MRQRMGEGGCEEECQGKIMLAVTPAGSVGVGKRAREEGEAMGWGVVVRVGGVACLFLIPRL